MAYLLGHDQHAHKITTQTGCSGTITIPVDGEHDDAANIFPIFDAQYTDNGGLTATAEPPAAAAPAGGALQDVLGHQHVLQDGGRGRQDGRRHQQRRLDRVRPVQAQQRHLVQVRVSSGGAGGTVQIRTGSADRHRHRLGDRSRSPARGRRSPPSPRAITGPPPAPRRCTSRSPAAPACCSTWTASPSPPAPVVRGGPGEGPAGKCLDVRSGATTDGTQIQLFTCSGSAAQTWTRYRSDVARRWASAWTSTPAAPPTARRSSCGPATARANQNWAPQSDGTLRNPQSGKCLDVSGNNSADGTIVHLWTCISSAANQKWTLP